MTNSEKNSLSSETLKSEDNSGAELPKKGPISFFTGALTSLLMAWISLLLSQKVVIYFTIHSPHYSSPIAQSIASAIKTLVIGMSFLATFTFAFIGLGLTLVFFRDLISGNEADPA